MHRLLTVTVARALPLLQATIAASLLLPVPAPAAGPPAGTVPDGMVLVTAGPFRMGNNNDFYDSDNDEKPQHVVDLLAFYIDRYPVTNRDYAAFVRATGHDRPRGWPETGDVPAGREDHPVVGVNWHDAVAYAQWKGRRLPTEQEFEKACRGTDARRWAWGNVFDKARAGVGEATTSPVTAHPTGASPYGALELSGSVWQWTSTWYDVYPDSPPNRTVQRILGHKVMSVRGGSFASDIGSARCADRGNKAPDAAGPSLGIRTALDVPGYEHYAAASEGRAAARAARARAVADITDYEEHQSAREQLAGADALLGQADAAFDERRFEESGRLASTALARITEAHERALDYKRQVIAKKEAETADVLDRLDHALRQLPPGLAAPDQARQAEAVRNLELGRQFQAEGGWGFAQMHGIIGLRQLESIGKPAAPAP